jgi:hypothetical protein
MKKSGSASAYAKASVSKFNVAVRDIVQFFHSFCLSETSSALTFQLFRCSPIIVNRDSGFGIREICES